MISLRWLPALLAPALLLAATEGEARADLISFGIGPMVAAGGTFLDKPSDKTYPIGGGRQEFLIAYPGFGGASVGGGLMADVRVLGFVGLEVDFIKKTDKGHGDIDLTLNGTKTTTTVEIAHDAWHIPVLLKGSIPLPLLAPFIVIGPEFVRTSNATASPDVVAGGTVVKTDATTSNYTMWTAGLGAEVKLPIPGLDIRIPISFRGSYYKVSDAMEGRVTYGYNLVNVGGQQGYTPTGQTFNVQWKYQALATLGAAIYF
jgi:hypothetical protein